jgi:CRP-like cAMP-binding protein
MDDQRIPLLKSLRLLEGIPEKALTALAEVLKPISLGDGQVLFKENTGGTSLYLIASGKIRISKKVAGGVQKDLALLAPGECLGEMAMFETRPRSASASAEGSATLFELRRDDLNKWLQSNPELAVGFFAHLLQIQSNRLRRTSDELALLFDLSSLLLEPAADNKELLKRMLDRVVPHLVGNWNAGAFLYNVYNAEMELAAVVGDFDFTQIAPPKDEQPGWIENATYFAPLPGEKRLQGYLVFRAYESFTDEERTETGRTLTAVARLVRTAVENVDHRTEEMLRGRLKDTRGSGI